MKKILLATAMMASLSACTRIPTGEVGLRVGFDKQVQLDELLPGSFNQTVIGSVLRFPTKEVSVTLDNIRPIAKDNSTMKEFDAYVIYSLNQSQVAEMYNTKSKAFHVTAPDGETYLMYNYIYNAAKNAIYKEARKYDALDMADNRQNTEESIKRQIQHTLSEEGLGNSITISQVIIRSVVPADSVVHSANALVVAKNAYKQKEVEVQTAQAESRRQKILAENGPQTIEYMKAQATLTVAEAIANGKVNTIVIPSDSSNLLNLTK